MPRGLIFRGLRLVKHEWRDKDEHGETLHPTQRWELNMPYVYVRVDDLENHEKVGTKLCVALIQTFTDAGMTASWRQGAAVLGNKAMLKGTAIATFIRGRYPNQAHGNHAAFFLRHGPNGFWVMDQWLADQKKVVSARYIESKGRLTDGTFRRASDNADAFSIIEPSQ